MFSGQSILGVSAAGLYGLVMLACLAACAHAARGRSPAAHVRNWAIIALVFAGLIMLRALNLEEMIRQDFRAMLRADNSYGDRRELQRPLVALVIVIAAPIAFLLLRRLVSQRHSRRELTISIAIMATLAMIGVLALRIISLHQVDALLYGPIKLNWITDIGASLAVLGAALRYVWLGRVVSGRRPG